MNEWQPIETAPLDTPVLVWDNWKDAGEGVAQRLSAYEGAWVWAKAALCDEYPGNGPILPTHWMPLPGPPTPKTKG